VDPSNLLHGAQAKYCEILSNIILHGSSFERLLKKVARDFAIFGPERLYWSILVRMVATFTRTWQG
jgi:hypothetical protein